MTDETFSEARTLLHLLFEKHGHESLQPIEVTSHAKKNDDHTLDAGNLSIVETSIKINALRRKHPRQPFIHTSLPDIFIKNDPSKLLLTFESWQKNIVENQTIEFYILPRGTFEDLERKLLSLVDGAIQIQVSKTKARFQSALTPVKCCKPEYHLQEFPYNIEGDRFLIYWEGEFTDRITGITKAEVESRMADHKKQMRGLKIVKGPNSLKRSASIHDFWLYSQLQNIPLYSIRELFPESFDSILEKIVRWEANGMLELIPLDKLDVPLQPNGSREPKLFTKIALKLPVWLTYRIFRRRTGAVGKVPVDLYLIGRNASVSLNKILMEKAGIESPDDTLESILQLEKNYNNYETRKTAIEHIKALRESPSEVVLDTKTLPKLLKLALRTGYEVDASVKQVAEDVFEFTVINCFFCRNIRSSTPICISIAGGVEALCSIMFKRSTEVEEIDCKASGEKSCRYTLTFVS